MTRLPERMREFTWFYGVPNHVIRVGTGYLLVYEQDSFLFDSDGELLADSPLDIREEIAFRIHEEQ